MTPIRGTVISQDPWFSTVQSPDEPDQAAFDFDPMPGVTFEQVRDVARWVHEELQRLEIPHVLKTSGASGLHLCPVASRKELRVRPAVLPDYRNLGRPQASGARHGGTHLHARRGRVYIDYLQNVRGKTLATAYSARASAFAGVSTPLTWKELEDGATPQDFTLRTMPGRIQSVGDFWKALRTSHGAKFDSVLEK
jgi:bifunctional non-homologous end joining protein LigD